MSKERELLNKAIEMIQIVPLMASIGHVPPDFGSELILEIQELLAQSEQEQEPVAWMWDEMFCEDWTTVSSVIKPSRSKYVDNVHPLYLTPPKREPEDDQYYNHIKEHKEQIEADFKEQQSEERWYANSLGDDNE